jgi:hypothetical protein
MNNDEFKMQERQLEARRDELLVEKKKHEAQLVVIKNLIRSSGRMENSKYKQCCDAQSKHIKAIAKIEEQLAPIKHDIKELYVREFEDRQISLEVRAVETAKLKQTVQALVETREYYQRFAADHTRVSSMRQMGAEFILRINDIIKLAISKPGKLVLHE